MEQEIKVSVICNVFNHEKYVRDALEGFVSQKTDFPFEVLVHDDASTDGSAAIIREYEQKYPELIKPIYQTVNQYSQNVDITVLFQASRAKGKYIATCEGDDYWTDPYKLQKQYDFLKANPEYTMCTTSVVWLDMNTNTEKRLCRTETDRDVSLDEIILEKKGRIFQYATFMVRRDVFCHLPEWVDYFDVGDTPLAIHAAVKGKVRMLADVTAVYRNHAQGSWSSRFEQDVQYKTGVFLMLINGLNKFDEATGYAYHEIVCSRIRRIRYNIARANRDLKAMRSGELREVWLSRPLPARMSDFLLCKAPRLQQFILRVLKRG